MGVKLSEKNVRWKSVHKFYSTTLHGLFFKTLLTGVEKSDVNVDPH